MSNTTKKDQRSPRRPRRSTKAATVTKIPKPQPKVEEVPVLEQLPPELKRSVETALSTQKSATPLPATLADKINEQHIEKVLELTAQEDNRRYMDNLQRRRYRLIYLVLGVACFAVTAFFMVGEHTDLFKEIVKLFFVFVGGIGTGYALKSDFDKKK